MNHFINCLQNRYNRLILAFVVALLFFNNLSIPCVLAAPTSAWEPAGFGGSGAFLTTYFDPTESGIVYATSDVAGIFRSTDHGDSWEMRNSGLGNYEIGSFAIDPIEPTTLLAGVGAFASSNKAGIYISHDSGLTWQHLRSTAQHGIDFRVHRTRNAIAIDPFNHDQMVILSGSRTNGIWRSGDGGSSWTQVMVPIATEVPYFFSNAGGSIVDDPTDFFHPAPVSSVLFDPNLNGTVYTAIYGVGLFKSTSGGVANSWQAINNGLPANATVHQISIGPNSILYAALGEQGLYKSTDGGSSWQSLNNTVPLADFQILSVTPHPTEPNIAYFTQERVANPSDIYPAVWKSIDGGDSWFPTAHLSEQNLVTDPTQSWWFEPISSWHLSIDPFDPERLIYLLGGIYRSEDGGTSWQTKPAGAQIVCVTDTLADGETLFATHMDTGLLISTDQGNRWEAILPASVAERDAYAGHYWGIEMVRTSDTTYYYVTASPWARGYSQVLRSSDGRNWKPVFTSDKPGGRGVGRTSLAADPSRAGTLYFAQDGGLIFKTTDFGNRWSQTASQPNASLFDDLVVDEVGRLFATGFYEGLWRSTDGGGSWSQIFTEQSLIHDLEVGHGFIYAASGDGNLYRSADGGDSWQQMTDFPPGTDSDGSDNGGLAVALNPDTPHHIVFSRYDIWHFADDGDGLYESRDGGNTWTPLNEGLGLKRISTLSFGPNGILYAGTFCGGLWRHSDMPFILEGLEEQLYMPVIQR